MAVVLCAVIATSTVACGRTEVGGSRGELERGVVEVVYDGDTVRLADGTEVRLAQIDAPEEDRECYGEEATEALVDLAPRGTEVALEPDPALGDTDQYGRLLRYVFVDGRNVNVELVDEGAAAPYFYKNVRGRYADDLMDAVDDARRDGRGMWSACPDAELNPGLGSVSGPA